MNDMHEIYLGYSLTLDASAVLQYFDVLPEYDEDDSGKGTPFEEDFGLQIMDKGDYEAYDRSDLVEGEVFGPDFFNESSPFIVNDKFLSKIDFQKAKSVFFVEASDPKIMSNDKVILIGPMYVEKFNYE